MALQSKQGLGYHQGFRESRSDLEEVKSDESNKRTDE